MAAVAILLGMTAGGVPPLATIQDMLFKADGTRFNGLARIVWTTFSSGGIAIPQQTRVVRIIDGNLWVQLTPTTNAVPAARYTVTYNSDGKIQFTEFWQVPPSNAPLQLKDVRTGDPLFGGAATQVQESDVIGLVQDLASRPVRGSGFVNSRAAVVSSSGEIESALGASSDCVRVDGTSGACGGGSAPLFADAETPTGAANGVNAVFTLVNAPNPATSLALYRNGVLQKLLVDFTLSSNLATFYAASTPQTGDILTAYYRTLGGVVTPIFADQETPLGAVNGVNAAFTLAAAPNPVSSLMVFRNGILKRQGIDYTVGGNSVTFLAGQIPQSGDNLTASYRR
ncbi:MAG: hypothetical protein HY013_00975 [Candidatus Solibacter usitatus]|nr:hypothetical protein [Candidatus Solibacter usitatus]